MSNESIVTLHWSDLAGGGVVASILLLALVERLRRTFATRADLNGLGDRVTGLHDQVVHVADTADAAEALATRVQAEQKHQWVRVAEQVMRPLERITEKLESVSVAQAAQAAAMEQISRRLDVGDRRG
ncbi:MAG: hypothetical protein JWM27_1551 [Gemmatimonadetes bacterium]|nr:hypothetical protein [Gemmatimonadota bacterium]